MKASLWGARRSLILGLALAMLIAPIAVRALKAQSTGDPANSTTADGAPTPILRGIPNDWSHHHLIFSRPGSPEMERRLERDPRYPIQKAWRTRQAQTATVEQYMQSLDAVAKQLATAPHLAPLNQHTASSRKKPRGAWGESLNVVVNNANGSATYPAKFAFTSSSSCSDWVVFTVPVIGSGSQFDLFAFKNLYTSTCSGGPTLKFAYDVSSAGGSLLTAPVLSLSGDQVAFIEGPPTATLQVVKFTDLTSAPSFPNPNPASLLSSCGTAPCRNSITYTTQASATLSAPFYDYTTGQDTAYVSDDNSTVWAISPVFGGTPTKKSGWTSGILVNNTTPGKLTAPVYDSTSKNVFVGDNLGNLYYIRTQNTSAGTCNGSTSGTPCLGDTLNTALCTGVGTPQSCCTASKRGCQFLKVSTTNKQIVEPVIVDSTTEKVFVFSNGNPTTSGSSVVQTDVQLGVINVASIGSGTTNAIHQGTFDNNYYNDPTTGHLYVCGQIGGVPQLYAFGFTNNPTAGTMNTSPVTGSPIALAKSTANCSPLTEDDNGTTDNLFVAVTANCPATNATSSGCVLSFNITSGFPSLSSPPYSVTFSQSSSLGTSTGTAGIIIDNTTGTTNQTNIYFETQGAGTSCSTYSGGTTNTMSCAVSLTQSLLN